MPERITKDGIDFLVSGSADYDRKVASFVVTQVSTGNLTLKMQKSLAMEIKSYVPGFETNIFYPALEKMN